MRAGVGDRGNRSATASENELDVVDRHANRYTARGNELHAADIDEGIVRYAAVIDALLAAVPDRQAQRRAEHALRLSKYEGAPGGRLPAPTELTLTTSRAVAIGKSARRWTFVVGIASNADPA